MKQLFIFILLFSCLYSKKENENSDLNKIKNNIEYKYKFKCKSIYIIDKNNDLIKNYKNEIIYLYQNNEKEICIIKNKKNVLNFFFFGKGRLVDELLKKSWYYIYKNKFLNINLYIQLFENSENDIPDIVSNNSEIYLTFGKKIKSFLCEKMEKERKKEK